MGLAAASANIIMRQWILSERFTFLHAKVLILPTKLMWVVQQEKREDYACILRARGVTDWSETEREILSFSQMPHGLNASRGQHLTLLFKNVKENLWQHSVVHKSSKGVKFVQAGPL